MADITPGPGIDLTGLTQRESSLTGAAGGGFAVEPDAARQAARICQNYAGRISDLLNRSGLNDPPFLGSFWMANNLSQHFHNKAIGTTASTANTGPGVGSATDANSLTGQIAGIVQLMNNLGRIFGAAADTYEQNEQGVLGSLHGIDGRPS
jgi:hypothetical protein